MKIDTRKRVRGKKLTEAEIEAAKEFLENIFSESSIVSRLKLMKESESRGIRFEAIKKARELAGIKKVRSNWYIWPPGKEKGNSKIYCEKAGISQDWVTALCDEVESPAQESTSTPIKGKVQIKIGAYEIEAESCDAVEKLREALRKIEGGEE